MNNEIKSKVSLESVEGSFLTRDRQFSYAFRLHAADKWFPHGGKVTAASFCMLLRVYYSLSRATSIVLWPTVSVDAQ